MQLGHPPFPGVCVFFPLFYVDRFGQKFDHIFFFARAPVFFAFASFFSQGYRYPKRARKRENAEKGKRRKDGKAEKTESGKDGKNGKKRKRRKAGKTEKTEKSGKDGKRKDGKKRTNTIGAVLFAFSRASLSQPPHSGERGAG